MRAMLVIEMPESCLVCPCGNKSGDECCVEDRQVGTYEDEYIDGQYERPNWCPLMSVSEEE